MTDVVTQLSGLALFAGATHEELERLAAVCFPKKLGRGQVLFCEGEQSEHLYVVVSGRIKITVGSDRGDVLVLNVVGPGEPLGELSVLDGYPRTAGAEALDDVALLCVPATAMRRLLAASPDVCLALVADLAARLRDTTGVTADLVFLDLPRRLAKLLAGLPDGRVDLPQAELAAQLGVTRPPVNRSLSAFQSRGWVDVSRGQVAVLDREALARFAGS